MSGRLTAWSALVGAQILLGYAARATEGKPDRNVVYHWSTFAQSVVYPTVALDKARLRTIVSSEHSRDDLQACLDAFGTAGHELRLI